MNEPNKEALDQDKKNELNQEALDLEKMNDPNLEALDLEKMNELNQEALDLEKMNELNQEALDWEKMNDPNQEALYHNWTIFLSDINEPNQKPLDQDKKNKPNKEELDQDKKNELNQEALDLEKMNDEESWDHEWNSFLTGINEEIFGKDEKNEPNQEALDHDTNNETDQNSTNADQLERRPNFVTKITNTVRNVANYLKSNGSRVFIWRRSEPENNADAGERATNDQNAAPEGTDLLSTIKITQKQIDKRLQCNVCLDEYELNEEAMKLICNHIFHEKCITHWIVMHGTCPVCRKYFCPGELHLPQEQIGMFRSIVRRVSRTLCAPLIYFFPSLGLARDRPGSIPMYRLLRAERLSSIDELPDDPTDAMIEDYIFCHVMYVLQNRNREQYTGPLNSTAANMRRRFSRLYHREPDTNSTASEESSAAERREFQFPTDLVSTEFLGHY